MRGWQTRWIAPGPIHSQPDQEAGALLNPKATPADLNLDCCFLFQDVLFHREAGAGYNLSTPLLGAIWFLDSSRGPHKGSWKAKLSCRVGPGPSCLSSSQRRSLVPTQGKISEKAELSLATFCWVVLSTGICCLESMLIYFLKVVRLSSGMTVANLCFFKNDKRPELQT